MNHNRMTSRCVSAPHEMKRIETDRIARASLPDPTAGAGRPPEQTFPLTKLFSKIVLILTLTTALTAVALTSDDAHAQGLLGAGEMSAGASVLVGDRLDGGGFGFTGHFEYAGMFEETALGGYMGFEFLTLLGYESYNGVDPYGGENTMGPLLFDLAVGFPVTLFKLGNGGSGTTLLTIGIGAGMSAQHAYGYVRSRILTKLGAETYIELMGRWTPSEASNDWTEKTGLDVYEARVSFITPVSEDLTLQFFGEWSAADRTRTGTGDPTKPAIEPPEVTTNFQSIWRFGAGFIF